MWRFDHKPSSPPPKAPPFLQYKGKKRVLAVQIAETAEDGPDDRIRSAYSNLVMLCRHLASVPTLRAPDKDLRSTPFEAVRLGGFNALGRFHQTWPHTLLWKQSCYVAPARMS